MTAIFASELSASDAPTEAGGSAASGRQMDEEGQARALCMALADELSAGGRVAVHLTLAGAGGGASAGSGSAARGSLSLGY
jgi:hypothetical protein